ncbi:hypothetical protein HDU98_004099 [Podochytrium sp. JEL0797]|nr:hypothetical protein HDU98_004099 [Podochytrium sp. JEL0797]
MQQFVITLLLVSSLVPVFAAPRPQAQPQTDANYNSCAPGFDHCGAGFTCCVGPGDVSSGKATCRPSNDCSGNAPQPQWIPDWNSCSPNFDKCSSSGFVCCVAPADESNGKSTCRPTSACYATKVVNYNTCTMNVDTCNSGYTCCIGSQDLAAHKSTCRPNSDCSGTTSSGSISSFISASTFNNAAAACGVTTSGTYNALNSNLGVKISGLVELALLMGNLDHESGGLTDLYEGGCNQGQCAYGNYFGRGFIQLTWQSNYQAAADALGRPDIVSNPDVVASDPGTDWAVTGWFWRTSVQPVLKAQGYTIASSVRAINNIECAGGSVGVINAQRISDIQCFEQQFGIAIDWNTSC